MERQIEQPREVDVKMGVRTPVGVRLDLPYSFVSPVVITVRFAVVRFCMAQHL